MTSHRFPRVILLVCFFFMMFRQSNNLSFSASLCLLGQQSESLCSEQLKILLWDCFPFFVSFFSMRWQRHKFDAYRSLLSHMIELCRYSIISSECKLIIFLWMLVFSRPSFHSFIRNSHTKVQESDKGIQPSIQLQAKVARGKGDTFVGLDRLSFGKGRRRIFTFFFQHIHHKRTTRYYDSQPNALEGNQM